MPVTRMRMRPWLVMMIDSNTVTGLEWVDKEKTMFTIPWKHAARHGWDLEKDACLFQKWAIHTGKYGQGQSTDPKTWKANFRCALNSLPDIEEVKDKSINKGHQAKRVFRMLPVTPKSRDKRNKAKELKARRKSSIAKTDEEMEDTSDTQSSTDESVPEDALSPQENTVDSTVNTEQQELPFPDWSLPTEFTWHLPDNFCHRLEVSPDHSTDYEDPDEIIKICEELERDTLKMNPFNHNRPVSNYACTSPGGSQWSDSSSVDEVEEFRQYTTLGSDLVISTEDMYLNFPGHLL